MAQPRNDRDLILQTAAARTIKVDDPAATIIPGYTGITLVKDIQVFIGAGANTINPPPYAISPDRMVLTAQLKGIPSNNPVTWHTGTLHLNDISGDTFFEEPTSIILTNTGDPLVRTIEASSYPYSAGIVPRGFMVVRTSYGGVNFESNIHFYINTQFG